MSEPYSKSPACPICRKAQAAAKFAPFCSRRCADLDLGRWLKGSYAIPGSAAQAETPDQRPAQDPEDE
jgi:endogenous inhibitor of DNA gyrase (YacG/DUF329 family)